MPLHPRRTYRKIGGVRPFRPVPTAALAGIGIVLAAGCGSTAPSASQPPVTPSARTTEPVSTPATSTTSSAPSVTSPPQTAAPETTTAEPTLGRGGAVFHGIGFGESRPTEVFLGGDPTGDIDQITWSTWGGSQATGTGTSVYVAPDQSTAQGSEEPATIVAFDLGICNGVPAYQAVEWYFPQHSGFFDPNSYMNACTGSFSPNYTGMR